MRTIWVKCMAAGFFLLLIQRVFALDAAKYYGGSYDGYGLGTTSGQYLRMLDATKYYGGSYDGHDLATASGQYLRLLDAAKYFGGMNDGFCVGTASDQSLGVLDVAKFHGGSFDGYGLSASASYVLPESNFTDVELAILSVSILFNESGDGHTIDMTFSSLTGSGNVTVLQTNVPPPNAPCQSACGFYWVFTTDAGISDFSTAITFHYTDEDLTGYTESSAFLGIAKFNASTSTWTWLGGTVNAGANTVTVNGVTSFSDFALFRRIFGDITGDGYVDASDLQRLGDCWHDTNSGEFTGGSDARFFNFNNNTDDGNQIIDAADLQVFGDCWHNGTGP